MRFARTSRFAIGAVAVTLALTSAACGGSSSHKSKNGLEKSTITVGILPILDCAGLKLAETRGFFKSEGLDVKLQVMQGGADSIPAMKSGRMDIAFGNYVSYFAAQSRGTADLKIVADAYAIAPGTHTILVRQDSPIHSAKDLAGKKIAINQKRNVGALLVRANLLPFNVTLNEDRDVVEIPFPNMEAALKSKSVDAALFVEPFNTRAQQSLGARPIIDMSQGPTAGFPAGGYVTTADYAKKYPKTVAAFQRAIAKAQPLLEDRKVLREVIPTFTKIQAATVPGLHFGSYTTTTSATRLQRVADVMMQFGYLSKRLDVKPMIMSSASGQ